LALAVAGLLMAACATQNAIPAQPPSVTLSRLPVEVDGLRLAAGIELVAAYHLTSSDRRFGGISAIESSGDGLWLLSDRARLWQAVFTLDVGSGKLRLEAWQQGAIRGDDEDQAGLDSEALALAADGALVAAFEHDDSVRRLQQMVDGSWQTERLHPGRLIEWAPPNQGIEALAIAPDGALLALSEGARAEAGVAVGARLADHACHRFGYRLAPGFSPVGAATAAADLYVLERSLSLVGGWQSRLTRQSSSAINGPAPGTLAGETLLRIDFGPLAENYEGVAVLERPGEPRLILLISDDNQSALQRTLLLVLRETG